MTDQDKTQEKLLDSIRKTKQAVAKSPSTAKPAAPSKSAAKRPAPSRAAPVQRRSDPYQSGRRVWPD